jgi:patatin-related protein
MAAPATAQPPQWAPVQETRFAVVIYGGVSLAIYINGVVQEMLRMVRSTASSDGQNPLLTAPTGTEAVYRKLGQILGDPDGRSPVALHEMLKTGTLPIRTRLVVDVLSGTSAGGINAIFLAKALANNQSLDELKGMWIDEGDISVLLNDSGSVEEPLTPQKPPQSLLNSQRMYLKLLRALDGMDTLNNQPSDLQSVAGVPLKPSPLVEQLDLFSTTTDISGIALPMHLADGVVFERRHRNVFHFQHRSNENRSSSDFTFRENPFLAFAARCTSAFPFAFEPMALNDIFPIVKKMPLHRNQPYCDPDTKEWQRFYRDYIDDPDVPFPMRAFGDGGYLDNKPFTYAIETILKRHADLPVDRKLIYVEPSPERPAAAPVSERRPDAIENSLAALITLPRYETIRQDLERILQRNVDLARIGRVIAAIESAFDDREYWIKMSRWATMDFDAMRRELGPNYVAYQRLKLSTVIDELSDRVARAFHIDPDSGYGRALRLLGSEWRHNHYSHAAANIFLRDFDVAYRIRRLRHVMTKSSELFRHPAADEDAAEFRDELLHIRRDMRAAHDLLCSVSELMPPAEQLAPPDASPLSTDQLWFVLEPHDLYRFPGIEKWPNYRSLDRAGMETRAKYLLTDPAVDGLLNHIAAALQTKFKKAFEEAAEKSIAAFADEPRFSKSRRRARELVRLAYERFEIYDSNLYPIQYGTDIGEGEPIDVIRISPDDARELSKPGAAKLKGAAVSAFGAFLDQSWRHNDMLWGRLDGAERLISAILPSREPEIVELRKQLIAEAHEQIVIEELRTFRDGRLREAAAQADLVAALRANQSLTDSQRTALDVILQWKEQLQSYLGGVSKNPNPEMIARSAARATTIIGQMMEDLGDQRVKGGRRVGATVTRIGRAFWGFVEVATPRSLLEILSKYWLQILYLLCAILIVAGSFLSGTQLVRLGLTFAAWVAVVHAVRNALQRYMRGQKPLSAVVGLAAGLILLGVLLLGALQLQQIDTFRAPPVWRVLAGAAGVFATAAIFFGAVTATRSRPMREVVAAGAALREPLMALSFVSTWDDLKRVLGTRNPRTRQLVREALFADTAFLAAYSLTFVCFGGLIALLNNAALGMGIALAGFTAGVCDFLGNRRILALTFAPIPDVPTPDNPPSPRWFAYPKYLFSFGATLLVGFWLWQRANGGPADMTLQATAALALLSGTIGILGLFSHRLLRGAIAIAGLMLLLLAFITLISPTKLAPFEPGPKVAGIGPK